MPKKGTVRGSGPLIALVIAAGILLSAGGPTSAQFFNFGGSHHRPHSQRGAGWFGGGWFGNGPFDPLHQRALRPRWDRRRLATPVRDDFHRVHQAQRTSGSLKLHEVMTKPDREPVQSFGARTSYEIHEPKAEPTISAASVDPSADVVEVPQPPVTEPKAEPVIGTAPVDPSADIVQVPAPPVIEPKAEPTISAASVDPSADIVQVPAAGCWRLTLRWSRSTDALDLRYVARRR